MASPPDKPRGGPIFLPGFEDETRVEITKYFAGPLPSPDALFEYDAALPGAADRIVSMAEREALHCHAVEQRLVAIQARNSVFGIASGLTLGISAILGGVYAVVHGADIAGAGVALTALAALAGVFITQQRAARTEAELKEQS